MNFSLRCLRLFGAFVLLFTSAPFVAFAQVDAIRAGVTSAAGTAGLRGACSGTTCVANIIGRTINVAVTFLGMLLVCYFLYAGFLWMTSEGDAGVKKAKDMIQNSIIGLIIVVCSFALSTFVLEQLGTITSGTSSSSATTSSTAP